MKSYSFKNTQGGSVNSQSSSLVAGAPLVNIGVFDVSNIAKLSVTFAVANAALTGVTVFGRGDKSAQQPIQIPITELLGYGRSDAVSTDYTTTPAGQSGFVAVDTSYWSEVTIQATSAGAASVTTTAGFEASK